MKKIIVAIIGVVGFVLIGVGVMSTSFFSSKTVIVSKELSTKESTIHNRYQQQLITNIEKSLQEGYEVPQGTTKVPTSTFFESTNIENLDEYKDCGGEVDFVNQDGLLHYQLNTKCKKDTGDLHINYTVANIPEQTLSSASIYKVSNGYIIIGATDENESTDQYTANSLILKFDQNHNLIFSKKISDITVENINSQSHIEIRDVLEDSDGYYILGEVQNAKGGDLSNLIKEMTKIYEDHSIETNENNFAFLMKYDKNGNLISEKLINPIDGDLSVSKLIKKKGQILFIASNSKIIKYNTTKDKFSYYRLPNVQIETSYLDQDFIYGYSIKCNIETEKNPENKDALIKLNLSGKKIWQQPLEIEKPLKKEECSDLIEGVYRIDKGHILVYNKMLSLYDDEGKNIKNIDYSPLTKGKKERIKVLDIRQKQNEIEVFIENNSHLIVDTLDEKYQLKERYAANRNHATELLDNTGDIENIVPTENGLILSKILRGEKGLSIVKIEYDKK